MSAIAAIAARRWQGLDGVVGRFDLRQVLEQLAGKAPIVDLVLGPLDPKRVAQGRSGQRLRRAPHCGRMDR
jgi:hypothetical protein